MLPNYSKTSEFRSCPVIGTRTQMSRNSFSSRRYHSARCFLLYSGPHLPRSSGQRVVTHPTTASSSSLYASTIYFNNPSSIFQHSTFCAAGICDTRRTKINFKQITTNLII